MKMRMKSGKRVSVSMVSIETIYLKIQGSVLSYTGAKRNKEAVVSLKRHSIILPLNMTGRPAQSTLVPRSASPCCQSRYDVRNPWISHTGSAKGSGLNLSRPRSDLSPSLQTESQFHLGGPEMMRAYLAREAACLDESSQTVLAEMVWYVLEEPM